MELTGNLKKQVETAENREAAKAAIEDAGMLLTDEELDAVSGGSEYGHRSKRFALHPIGVFDQLTAVRCKPGHSTDTKDAICVLKEMDSVMLSGRTITNAYNVVMAQIITPTNGWVYAEELTETYVHPKPWDWF